MIVRVAPTVDLRGAVAWQHQEMTNKKQQVLNPMARQAWERLQSEFPSWQPYLSNRDGELELAVPAPEGSQAGYFVAFSHENRLWIRFAPPYLSYAVDDEDEMVSIVRRLTTDEIVFKLTMKGNEWVETTLAERSEEPEFDLGQTVRFVSWSGKFDR